MRMKAARAGIAATIACALLSAMGLTHCESDDTPRTAPEAADAGQDGPCSEASTDGPSDGAPSRESSVDAGSADSFAPTDSGSDGRRVDDSGRLDAGLVEAGIDGG
jgi:hypothetical protein